MNRYNKVIIRCAMSFFWVASIFLVYYFSQYITPFNGGKTLYIAAWPLSLDMQYLAEFERKTGISVKVTYVETSEELLSKMHMTEGRGYDLIFPSDYTLRPLIDQGLLQKIDKTKLQFWDKLDKRLLGHYFDPGNDYSIPFYWAAYGIGFNKRLFGDHPPKTLGLIFDEVYNPKRIVMTNSAREAILTAGLYLFKSLDQLKKPEYQQKVRDLLLKQKMWVDIYTEERVDELLVSETNMLAFGLSPDITRAMRKNKNIGFIVPDEGSFLVIDSIALSVHSTNSDLAYTFLNYLYRSEVINHHIALYNMCSPIVCNDVITECTVTHEDFEKLHFLVDIISEAGLNNIWIDLLAY